MKSLFQEKYHTYIYYFSLCILVIGMPTSKFLISVAELTLLGNWLFEGNLKNKIISFCKNKAALVLASLLLIHFLGLLYTTHFQDAYLDLRIKVPLLVLPLILSTSKPLSENIFNTILKLFVATILFSTLVSLLVYLDVIHRPIVDIRGISFFISHIRFALLICVAVFISGYFIMKKNNNPAQQSTSHLGTPLLWRGAGGEALWIIIIIWLIVFLSLMESLTGIAVISITTFILILYLIIKLKNKLIKYTLLLLITASIATSVYYIATIINENDKNVEQIDLTKLEKYTSRGNEYMQGIGSTLKENGHLIWIYVCDKELKEIWNQRSKINYDSTDIKGNELRSTLARFLSSKGLRKDADALLTLTDDEIKAVERGVPNVNYQSMSSIKGRIYETVWEINLYRNAGDANGHSLTQRFEYWKVALTIIKNNLLFGVGTGDVQSSFDEEYIKMNSKLDMKWRLHSHNQYLSIAVAFGFIGLSWFLITLFYPMFKLKMTFDYLYITFFIIAIISFFTEDTLETQAGVTFFAFLNSFFLFARNRSASS